MKKVRSKKKSTKTVARVGRPAPKRAEAAPAVKSTTKFFGASKRGDRGAPRKQFHVLLTKDEHEALAKLTHKMQLSAADVFRTLLAKAK